MALSIIISCIFICSDGTSQNNTLSLNSKNGFSSGLVLTTPDYKKLSGSLLSLDSVRPNLSLNGLISTYTTVICDLEASSDQMLRVEFTEIGKCRSISLTCEMINVFTFIYRDDFNEENRVGAILMS